jgi:hypothetical protein
VALLFSPLPNEPTARFVKNAAYLLPRHSKREYRVDTFHPFLEIDFNALLIVYFRQ